LPPRRGRSETRRSAFPLTVPEKRTRPVSQLSFHLDVSVALLRATVGTVWAADCCPPTAAAAADKIATRARTPETLRIVLR
jgi:hypothetical protein